ncbi:hypothetical protein DENIS_2557 [Desulfonema ishimotonii]|uniref:Uncharacterized protein n=1 Tax=Desulfonema ishimotonii TaxID=45657 RepID=A0A401FXA4_9BACT|nr:SidJ-related pseudokinase [Desulfonema ishimotonii]GBC61595.1 hypothetical protein DENIS_2557 [Desulfonema ishimotonii]
MTEPKISAERRRLEAELASARRNFSGTYMSVGNLCELIREHPDSADAETVSALARVLDDRKFASRRQAFFLYRSAAETLTAILVRADDGEMRCQIMAVLGDLLATRDGDLHRAAAEALGQLPAGVCGPRMLREPVGTLPRIGWDALLRGADITLSGPPTFKGRSLIAKISGCPLVLAVKLARDGDCPESLETETVWADYLRENRQIFSADIGIPRPLKVRGKRVFRLERLPLTPPGGLNLMPGHMAIACVVHEDYFVYPNDHRPGKQLRPGNFREVMFRNARLLGEMSGAGIVQTAPIPLFHNRVQQSRRADQGLYEWFRGGRLDQWLFSCRFPNFGMSGVRDFEHLMSVNGSGRQIYRHIGTQLLSLLLVAGSYFRNRAADCFGFESPGVPVDARHLFDGELLGELVTGIFRNYFAGFTGQGLPSGVTPEVETLVARMIEEMGVDNDMEEILRVADQDRMTDGAFRAHLRGRGVDREAVGAYRKGEREIVLHTGPHLGGFNQRISLPELIGFLETASALCVAYRYLRTGAAPLMARLTGPSAHRSAA